MLYPFAHDSLISALAEAVVGGYLADRRQDNRRTGDNEMNDTLTAPRIGELAFRVQLVEQDIEFGESRVFGALALWYNVAKLFKLDWQKLNGRVASCCADMLCRAVDLVTQIEPLPGGSREDQVITLKQRIQAIDEMHHDMLVANVTTILATVTGDKSLALSPERTHG